MAVVETDKKWETKIPLVKDPRSGNLVEEWKIPPALIPPKDTKSNFDWKPWATAFGGGFLLHTLASSLMNNKTDEEKRRESIWERLLSAVIPLGIGGLGMYGGYRLGKSLSKEGEATEPLDSSKTITNGVSLVTTPSGDFIEVPKKDAHGIEHMVKFLKQKELEAGGIDLDKAYENQQKADEADEFWGPIYDRAEPWTTWGQWGAYGYAARKALESGKGNFADTLKYLKRSGVFKKRIGEVDTQISQLSAQLKGLDGKTPAEQQQVAELTKNLDALNKRKGMYSNKVKSNRGRAAWSTGKGVGNVATEGVFRAGKPLMWGIGLSALDSFLENQQDEIAQNRPWAEWSRNNLRRVKSEIENSKEIDVK